MCLASTGDNACPKPSVAVQQLDDVVDDAALQQPRPGTASPPTPTARDTSHDWK